MGSEAETVLCLIFLAKGLHNLGNTQNQFSRNCFEGRTLATALRVQGRFELAQSPNQRL